ncbi:hypothetical protein BGK38_10040 [Corynebacterium diphtheriae]|nr:hypothetical protein CDCE8392_2006 [Corynebacterium diphtheriae CDCE 8392]APM37205.1 hypothetical protein BS112_06570 [Corynebacterium diphtheriae]OWM97418.1 hypothetical protein AY473_00305 [Corynebacterium diphtheriae bv. mitis]OWN10479.1 hypothetical protein AY479_09345 [Corynebacterium belfantii]OWN26562.1 hypothetical protein AY503_10610 [Corynebacterium diphtheriae bv. gravis]
MAPMLVWVIAVLGVCRWESAEKLMSMRLMMWWDECYSQGYGQVRVRNPSKAVDNCALSA